MYGNHSPNYTTLWFQIKLRTPEMIVGIPFFQHQFFVDHHYHTYPKYLDTLTPSHTCSKIWLP